METRQLQSVYELRFYAMSSPEQKSSEILFEDEKHETNCGKTYIETCR